MSRLSWNEIRVRAHKFALDWKDAKYERGETQSFYNDFFEIFGVPRRKVANFEQPVKKLGDKQGFIDLFWAGKLIVEQKSAGRSLANARQQAFEYFPGLKDHELPRYLLACDFQNFELFDLENNEEVSFKLAELPNHITKFSFILGVQKREFKDQDPVNIKASVLMGRLHDELHNSNYKGHDLERFLVRLLFCLFADDTGIFEPRDIFFDYLKDRTSVDGTDVGPKLHMIFQTLATSEENRATTLDEDLMRFPYVNGDLFAEVLQMPSFDSRMRELLLEACEFSWEAISPAIFGALFQHVSGDAAARRAHGEHYTTENHIMRLIGPLFLDDLKSELASIKLKKQAAVRDRELMAFCKKLTTLSFFDPACGCGNFLVIAYREIRLLEIEAIAEYYRNRDKVLDNIESYSGVDVHQCYGIEINEFPARIAEVAMWMMDHIMNNRLSLELTKNFARIPLKKSPSIVHGDALELDWKAVLDPSKCSYVLGNPPFLGAKIQSAYQREQVRRIAGLGKSGGTLDFVCAWYFKAAEYVQGTNARIAFVSTNSISQGEQVAQLWPSLFNRFNLEIFFAHRTFEWSSDAKGKAHVHVVIIGLTMAKDEPRIKRLFSYPDIRNEPVESTHTKLSPYLIDASRLEDPHLVVYESRTPMQAVRPLKVGSKPVDGGNLILSPAEYERLLVEEPASANLVRPYVDAQDFVEGRVRYIISVQSATPADVRASATVLSRLQQCRQWRLGRSSAGTLAMASIPGQFHVTVIPDREFLLIPRHTSEQREYVPIGFVGPPTIPSDASIVLLDATIFEFSILTSAMHMSWLRNIGGKLKSDFRYAIGIVYNTFPWPEVSSSQRRSIELLGQSVLDARAKHRTSTLADLYNPNSMPANLRQAHKALDVAVDKLYRPAAFKGDVERVEHLLGLYERMTSIFKQEQPARKKRDNRAD
ncbi:MAG TPA: N-6 DNA methylase [Fimbriimonadaceae bacterium]|nr:SAM-dependent methyltransferase [Armatimonadota bacterium]HRI73361.1 N-6 DNA methylase [Fimbriimonadaceae bacterium]